MHRSILTLLAIGLLTPSVAFALEEFQKVVPPEHVVPGLRTVALIDHGNGWHDAFNDSTAATLRDRVGHRDDVPEVDAGLRSEALDFIVVNGPAQPSADEVQRIASESGAQAVLAADGEGGEIAFERWTEDRTKVTVVDGVKKEEHYTVSCAKREVEARWSATLYSGADGSVITSDAGVSKRSDKDCDEKGSDSLVLASANDMIRGIIEGGAAQFTRSYSPSWDNFRIAFPRDRVAKPAKEEIEAADWGSAVYEALAVLEQDPYNAAAVYYIGLALEFNGRAAEASELYRFADRLQGDGVYGRADERAQERVGQLAALAELGQTPRSGTFDGIEPTLERARYAAEAAVRGEPATVKGSGNKRVPVTADADRGSDILVALPAGTAVRVLRADGDRALVQLPDGHEGWLDNKQLR